MPEQRALTTDPWLGHFPRHQQPVIRAWFAACRLPSQTPEDLLHRVSETVARRLEWQVPADIECLCEQVLLALLHQRPQAEAFARALLTGSPNCQGGPDDD